MDIEIRKALNQDKYEISKIIVSAFGYSFKNITNDTSKLLNIIHAGIDHNRFYVAINQENNEVVGIVGYCDNTGYHVKIDNKVLRKELGFFKSIISKMVMVDEFYRPKVFLEDQSSIDFVSVKESARGQGIARSILKRVLQDTKYSKYRLDVVEGNERVIPLYESLGFIISYKEKETYSFIKDHKYKYVMEYNKSLIQDDSTSH